MGVAALVGGVAGLAVGGAYLGGVAAKHTTTRVQAERIVSVRSAGYTEEALSAAAGGLNASALSIARRHDPYTTYGAAQRDRQAEILTARLESQRERDNAVQRISAPRRTDFTSGPAARPFRFSGGASAGRDLECLTQAVYYEARGEGRDGMAAVAQVVLNRARHSAFPGTICGVVYQGAHRATGCQFSFTCNGAMRRPVNQAAWRRAEAVAEAALAGQVYAPVGAATHFHTTGVSPRWRHTLVQTAQVGTHVFYRFGGRNGAISAFSQAADPSTEADTARPAVVQASLDPVETVRHAGAALAVTAHWVQDMLDGPVEPRPTAQPPASAPSPQPRPQAAAVVAPAPPAPASPPKAAPTPVTPPAS